MKHRVRDVQEDGQRRIAGRQSLSLSSLFALIECALFESCWNSLARLTVVGSLMYFVPVNFRFDMATMTGPFL